MRNYPRIILYFGISVPYLHKSEFFHGCEPGQVEPGSVAPMSVVVSLILQLTERGSAKSVRDMELVGQKETR